MLKQIETLFENPEDKPDIALETAEYLQVRLNASFLYASNKIAELKNKGASESYILGFITGCEYASNIIDYIQQKDDDE